MNDVLAVVKATIDSNIGLDNYHWAFAPAFPVELFVGAESVERLRTWLWNENYYLTLDRGLSGGRQYYDSYWGWWNSSAAKSGADCPIIALSEDWYAWDGYHRSTIAAVAGLKIMPAIVGVPKARIIVSDPKHADSPHRHSFVGSVVSIFPTAEEGNPRFVIRDADDRAYIVELDELKGVAEW